MQNTERYFDIKDFEMNTYKMYMMTPRDQISQDLSYFSGPNTSGAETYANKVL